VNKQRGSGASVFVFQERQIRISLSIRICKAKSKVQRQKFHPLLASSHKDSLLPKKDEMRKSGTEELLSIAEVILSSAPVVTISQVPHTVERASLMFRSVRNKFGSYDS
jgi:hypothetical protein